MNTTMGMGKAKVWISETVGTKIATRLFRGLALGVLLVAATGLYFSINQGDQSEAGSPLVSEQGACYPLYPELGPCVSAFIAVTPTSADRNDRGLFDEVLPEDLKQGTAVSPLASEQGACYPLYPELGSCASEWIAVAPTIVDRYDRGLFDEIPVAAVEYWPEVGLDSNTYHLLTQGKAGN